MSEEMSNRYYLQHLCNKFGDFKVAKAWKQDGVAKFTKWRSVMDCWHSDEGLRFLDIANNRQILSHELVLDIEEPKDLPKTIKTLKKLGWFGKSKIYKTGSRGYHIHRFDVQIAIKLKWNAKRERYDFVKYRTLLERNLLRVKIIANYFPEADLMKANENSLIAIERMPHWKTGNPKIEVQV